MKRVFPLEEKKNGVSFFLFSTKKRSLDFSRRGTLANRCFPSLWDKESLRTDEGSSVVVVFRQSYYLVVDLQSKSSIVSSFLVVVFPNHVFPMFYNYTAV